MLLVNKPEKVLTRLCDWDVPPWLLRICASYLTERKMTVRYRGAISSAHSLPGGCAMGDIIGMTFALVQMSDLGMPPAFGPDTQVGDTVAVPVPAPAVTKDEVRVKWIDDVSLAEAVRLDECLGMDEEEFIGPREYHDRHGWVLDTSKSKLQARLNEIENYSLKNGMVVNTKKSKIIFWNWSKKFSFLPKLEYNSQTLDIVEKAKLLGVTINSKGRWNDHINDISNRAKSRIFFLRRLKELGASQSILKEIYVLFVRPILEYAAPVWTGALTENKKLTNKLNRVQDYACKVIRPDLDKAQAYTELRLSGLESRRISLSRKCAASMIKNPQFSSLFKRNDRQSSRNFGQLIAPRCNKRRYALSSVPFFISLLSEKSTV